MHRSILFAALLCTLATAPVVAGAGDAPAAQASITTAEVKVKKDVVYADGVPVARMEDDPAFRGSFYVSSVDGEHWLYMRWIFEGDHNYMEAYKPDDLKTLYFDQEAYVGHKKFLAKTLIRAGAITAGGLDQAKLDEYAAKTGTEMTRMRLERARR